MQIQNVQCELNGAETCRSECQHWHEEQRRFQLVFCFVYSLRFGVKRTQKTLPSSDRSITTNSKCAALKRPSDTSMFLKSIHLPRVGDMHHTRDGPNFYVVMCLQTIIHFLSDSRETVHIISREFRSLCLSLYMHLTVWQGTTRCMNFASIGRQQSIEIGSEETRSPFSIAHLTNQPNCTVFCPNCWNTFFWVFTNVRSSTLGFTICSICLHSSSSLVTLSWRLCRARLHETQKGSSALEMRILNLSVSVGRLAIIDSKFAWTLSVRRSSSLHYSRCFGYACWWLLFRNWASTYRGRCRRLLWLINTWRKQCPRSTVISLQTQVKFSPWKSCCEVWKVFNANSCVVLVKQDSAEQAAVSTTIDVLIQFRCTFKWCSDVAGA